MTIQMRKPFEPRLQIGQLLCFNMLWRILKFTQPALEGAAPYEVAWYLLKLRTATSWTACRLHVHTNIHVMQKGGAHVPGSRGKVEEPYGCMIRKSARPSQEVPECFK